MKRLLIALVLLACWPHSAKAHTVSLSWQASATPGCTYFIYRKAFVQKDFTRLNSKPVWATAYTDATVVAGHSYEYYVKAELNGIESAASSHVSVRIA
jgi:fibronectin type 3 domain-containing protein